MIQAGAAGYLLHLPSITRALAALWDDDAGGRISPERDAVASVRALGRSAAPWCLTCRSGRLAGRCSSRPLARSVHLRRTSRFGRTLGCGAPGSAARQVNPAVVRDLTIEPGFSSCPAGLRCALGIGCGGQDSNLRRPVPPDLKSGPFVRLRYPRVLRIRVGGRPPDLKFHTGPGDPCSRQAASRRRGDLPAGPISRAPVPSW